MGPILERSNIANATLRSAFFWVGNLLTPVRLWPFFFRKKKPNATDAERWWCLLWRRWLWWRIWGWFRRSGGLGKGHVFSSNKKGGNWDISGAPKLGLCWRIFMDQKQISRSKSPNLSKHGVRKDFDEIRIVGFVLHTRSCVLDFGFLFILGCSFAVTCGGK